MANNMMQQLFQAEYYSSSSSLLLLLWLALAAATLSVPLLRLRLTPRGPPLPPGPWPLPVIGNMLMMGRLTHRGLAALAGRHGGLFHLRLGRVHAVVVSSPAHAREVLSVQDAAFSGRPASAAVAYLTYGRADMAFAPYGRFWRQVRRLSSTRLFSSRRSQSWLAVRDESAALVRAIAESSGSGGEVVDVGELMFVLTKNVVFRAAFGAGESRGRRQEELVERLHEFSELMGVFSVGDFFPWLRWVDGLRGVNGRLRRARGGLDELVDGIIDEHVEGKKRKGDVDADMVDDMFAFLDDDDLAAAGKIKDDGDNDDDGLRLTRDNIKAIIMDFMFGGTETVAAAMEWAMAELLRSPNDLRRVQQELTETIGLDRTVEETDINTPDSLPFLRCIVKETLRLHPPVPLLLHESMTDCVVGGYTVPRRSRVIVNLWAIGRDRSAWGLDADTFRPARFVGEAAHVDLKGGCFELLPFGSGRRACPAMVFGMYEMELALARLLHAFEWALPDGVKPEELDMGDVFGLTLPRAVRLRAVPKLRLTCSL
ncbi:cytochrome P450 84A1 [Brachypodium distachyon]|uniref:Cytochrome P450 n=1 Tax=Brachypodium distachyon TaxID=15368 RepID=I1HAL7_BRADI|nr:cytochrome P450 84A1 [Brachypodium distachyon]PNT78334.1 hypothetical protein BRADI_1g77740v3 [Brachypodium distachyon]|eukprot:XP_003562202.1 cytochrome P450 84A1 [Brachypodium distachyon]